ncbi:MAG: hypothetical protein DDT26_02050 [Dehalococcoidia bacterium]|nr:hypothetical protein [Chloroflexota bacterium]
MARTLKTVRDSPQSCSCGLWQIVANFTQNSPCLDCYGHLTSYLACVTIVIMTTRQVTIEIKDLLNPTQAAKYLGVSRMTVWRWVKANKITPVMLDHAYFHIRELDKLKGKRAGD